MDKFVTQFEGISVMSIVLGFIGAVLGVSYMPPMSTKQLFAALVAGVVCGALLPSVIAAIFLATINWTVPVVIDRILALFTGLGGMFIVPGAIVFWQSAAKNPMSMVDWVRGKGPPPPPVDGGQK